MAAGRELEMRTSVQGGATSGTIWSAGRFFADYWEEEHLPSLAQKQTVLELGSGTGYLAMRLAAASKRTHVIATDVPTAMRNLKFNVNRNKLGHAVRLHTITPISMRRTHAIRMPPAYNPHAYSMRSR